MSTFECKNWLLWRQNAEITEVIQLQESIKNINKLLTYPLDQFEAKTVLNESTRKKAKKHEKVATDQKMKPPPRVISALINVSMKTDVLKIKRKT